MSEGQTKASLLRNANRQFSVHCNGKENRNTFDGVRRADGVTRQYFTRSKALDNPLKISEICEQSSGSPFTTAPVKTIRVGDSPTITTTPDEPPPITIMPDEPPTITITPDEPPAITIMPDESPAITITPDEPPATTIMPDEPPAITIMPDESPAITIMPDEPPVITITPDEPPAITIMPDEPPAITITPDEPPAITITPDEPPAITVIPDEPPIASVISNKSSAGAPTARKVLPTNATLQRSPPRITSTKRFDGAISMNDPMKNSQYMPSVTANGVNSTNVHSTAATPSSELHFGGRVFRVSKPSFVPVPGSMLATRVRSESNVCSKESRNPALDESRHSSSAINSVPRHVIQKSSSIQAKNELVKNNNFVNQDGLSSQVGQKVLGGNSRLNRRNVGKQGHYEELSQSADTEDSKYIPPQSFAEGDQEFTASSSDTESHDTVVNEPSVCSPELRNNDDYKLFIKKELPIPRSETPKNGLQSFRPLRLASAEKLKEKIGNAAPLEANFSNQQSPRTELKKTSGGNITVDKLTPVVKFETLTWKKATNLTDTSSGEALSSSPSVLVKPKLPNQSKRPTLLSFSDMLKRTLDSFSDSNSNPSSEPNEVSNLLNGPYKSPSIIAAKNEGKKEKYSPTIQNSIELKPAFQPEVIRLLPSDGMRQKDGNGKNAGGKLRQPSSSLDDTDGALPSELGEDASSSSNDEVFISKENVLKRQNHVQDDFKPSSNSENNKKENNQDSESEVESSDESESDEESAQLAENETSADEEMVRLIKDNRVPVKVVKGKSIKFSDNHHVIELDPYHRRNSDSRIAQLISYGSSMKKKSRKFVGGKDSGTGSNDSPSPSPKASTSNLVPHRKPNLKKTSSFGLSDSQTLSPVRNVSCSPKGSVSVQSSPRVKHRPRTCSMAVNSPLSRKVPFRPRCKSVDDRSAPGVCLVCNEWVGVHHDPHSDGPSNRTTTGDVLTTGENGGLSCGSPYNSVSLPSSPVTPHIVVSLDEDPPVVGGDFRENGQDLSPEDGSRPCQLAKSKSLGSCEDLGGSKSDLAGQIISGRGQMARHNSISSYLMPEIGISMQRKTRRNSMIGMMQRASSVNNISLTAAPAQLMRVPSNGTLRHGASKTSLAPSNCDWRREGNDSMISCLSALYGKILVVMGLAFPIGEFISGEMPLYIFKGFYLYLHLGSIIFLVYAYMFLLHVVPLPKVEIKSRLQNLKASTAGLVRQLSTSLSLVPQEGADRTRPPIKNDVERGSGGRNDDSRSLNTITTFQNNKNYTITESTHESMYLKMGAMVFGIGSMIYSGLEVGQYFDLKATPECADLLLVVSPVSRMLFTFIQMYFIFLNSRVAINKHRTMARFGLMHMIATNLCIWLNVLVEETKHEIHSLTHGGHGGNSNRVMEDDELYGHGLATVMTQIADAAKNLSAGVATTLAPLHHHVTSTLPRHDDDYFDDDSLHSFEMDSAEHHMVRRAAESYHSTSIYDCRKSDMMSRLVDNASPFLFPCTIEYSLLCSGVLYVIWKNINKSQSGQTGNCGDSDISTFIARKARHHYSVDCAHATRGLFMGILVLVLTIISLILFFVLISNENTKSVAILEANIIELSVYSVAIITVVIGMVQMRELEFVEHGDIELDNILLLIAQTGTYIYTSFTIIGGNFSLDSQRILPFFTAVITLIQTTLQTLFILNASRRCCYTYDQLNRKPGREMVTFLLICNLAMWAISTFETSRADAHPTLLNYYGVWAWTIISHVSMPLAIFYRFHVTVCLCEIWKRSYKLKHDFL